MDQYYYISVIAIYVAGFTPDRDMASVIELQTYNAVGLV